MKYFAFPVFLLLSVCYLNAQPGPQKDTSWKKIYRETPARINNLVHTRLEVKPDFSRSYLTGKAWITLRPHFYPTDSLTLDAKGMEFRKIALIKSGQQVPVKYAYDDFELKIKLDRTYKSNETYMVYIDYTAKPDEFEEKYSEGAMLGIKGMYFINPKASTQRVKNLANQPRSGPRVKPNPVPHGSQLLTRPTKRRPRN
jgi:aminopeptidase N